MDIAKFFADYGLIILLVVLLGFMFWSSRRRMQKQKAEQETKARQTVPGAEVMLQGGLYGTIVSYDPENLDQPAVVEIAPGVEIKVHSQAILRVVSPTDQTPVIDDTTSTGTSYDAPDADASNDSDTDSGAKPQA